MGVKEMKGMKKGWERGKDSLVEGMEIGRMFGDRFVRKMKKGKVMARVVAGLMGMLWLVEGKTSAEIEKVGVGGVGSCGIEGKVRDVAGKV